MNNQIAPEFDWVGADGNRRRLTDYRGAPVVLAFFPAEWDPARPHQIDLYNRALRQLPGQARLLNISEADDWFEAEVSGEGPVRFPLIQGISSGGEAAELFGVKGQQALIVLDGEGVERWRQVGPVGHHPSVDSVLEAIRGTSASDSPSRRQFMLAAVAVFASLTLLPRLSEAEEPATKAAADRELSLMVNGTRHRIPADPRTTLLDALRERIGLTGTKKGCDHGQCGACTVHVNGRRVNSCLMLAVQAEGMDVTTVEGLAHGDRLHPVQEAFIKHDGFQCGYCTSGQIMSAVACIREGHAHDTEEIKDWMSGNICRCGAYQGICEAIKEANQAMGGRA